MAIVSAVSGIFIAEGFSRFIKSDHCPEEVKAVSNTLIEPLKAAPIAQLICGTLSMVILAQGTLLIASKALKGRVNWIASSAQKVENALSVYRFSVPLLLTATVLSGEGRF